MGFWGSLLDALFFDASTYRTWNTWPERRKSPNGIVYVDEVGPVSPEYWEKTMLKMSELAGQATKHDQEKPRMELLSSVALEEVAKVLTFGAKKYDANNWRKGMDWSRLLGAALRHINAFNGGEDKDPETGLSHLAHASCCLMFLLEYEQTHKEKDDRYGTNKETK